MNYASTSTSDASDASDGKRKDIHRCDASDVSDGKRRLASASLGLRHLHSHLEICGARANASAGCAQEKRNFPFSCVSLASAHAFESRVNTPLASSKTPGKECLLYIGTTINDSKYISRNIELTLLILPEMILHV